MISLFIQLFHIKVLVNPNLYRKFIRPQQPTNDKHCQCLVTEAELEPLLTEK